MKKRLDDTKAIVEMPSANMLMPGKWKRDWCMPCPVTGAPMAEPETVGCESLRDAVDYLD